MTRFLCACLVGLFAAPLAHAGPWARDPGQVFVAFSAEHDKARNSHLGLYAEYGLSRRRVLGFELGHTDVGETTAMVWYQKSLDQGKGRIGFPIPWVSAQSGGMVRCFL